MVYIILYIIAGITTIFSEHIGFTMLMYISKVLLMPLLAIYFFMQSKKAVEYKFIYLALFFSWFGDIFLMFPRQEHTPSVAKLLFLCGLISFLIGHLNYILHFIKEVKDKSKVTVIIEKPYLLLPFILFIVSLLRLLYPTLGQMKIPVTIYAIIITSMLIAAFNRKNLVIERSYFLVFAGAILFVLSDSCIAINLFYKPFELARVVIMSTYILAQFLIIYGLQITVKTKN